MEDLVRAYLDWVRANPMVSAAIQFGILGTVGEHIPACLKHRKLTSPYKLWQLVVTIFGWALLGIIIKYGFTGMRGFVDGLLIHNLLPDYCSEGVARGIAVSVFTNILFGPQMMFFHRLEENLIMWRWNTAGLTRAWWTLIWFWIPAHSITFSLPIDYQIGLAACWSVVLGLIMGLTVPKTAAK
jgi:hypothetical protein